MRAWPVAVLGALCLVHAVGASDLGLHTRLTVWFEGGPQGLSHLRLDDNVTVSGNTSALLRRALDANADGNVSAAEAATFVGLLRKEGTGVAGRMGANMTLDGRPPAQAPTPTSLRVDGDLGPVHATGNITVLSTWSGNLTARPSDAHVLRIRGPPQGQPPVEVRVHPPDGFRIANATRGILLDVSTDLLVPDLASNDTVEVRFERTTQGAPSPALPLVLGVLVACAATVAVRRMGPGGFEPPTSGL